MTTTVTPSFVLTYDSLTATVLQYLERSDTATREQIPTFITMCEFEIAQQIKTLGQLQVAESIMEGGNPVIPKPARWRKTVSMKVNGQPILLRSQDYVAQYSAESDAGVPKYYADYDWVALCQLYGRMLDLPGRWPMFCRDLKQLSCDKNHEVHIGVAIFRKHSISGKNILCKS